ncbi:hypothetical protein [Nonomuraea harbinensis]|uniref:Uncharacterized protein n=1 Tax=Nonomuraea harbinensis TaxID=1286938 RepID=A0ABW1C621_9ACTN
MSTRVSGRAAQMRRVASMPSIAGMRTSMSTTSGRCRAASATASAPVAVLAAGAVVPLAISTTART